MYRVTKKRREQLDRMREAKAAQRIAGPPPEYRPDFPLLRRRVTIEDFDFGYRVHTMEMYRTSRCDCYRVEVDGKPWKARIGWSRILEGLRKSLPRVGTW